MWSPPRLPVRYAQMRQWRTSRNSSKPGRHEPSRRDSRQRANVLVQMEEIARIVVRFDFLEPSVVWPVGGGDWIARLIVAQVVHIAARGEEGFHLRIRFPRPCDAPIGIFRLHPFRDHDKVVTFRAVREGRVAD